MPILVILIVFSLAFYVFYKIKYVRSTKLIERKWISSKSGIALGLFVLTFGLNQLYLNHSTVSYIVAAVFVVLGGINIWSGIKAYKYYLPYAIEEAEGKN
ncbi:YtpI family protein [Neobacillus sp. YIM B06451]|uniref:YtpI family protein n=1 Tax=Neobacillus sp. YIM B06451 TaxID=3070994 RepID=UPI00292E89A3|nr:YtpI family protein [Neobacillus sp. YIM B06451]